MPSSLKLFYYDSKGRAELTRLILTAGGKEYENVILTPEDWKTEKDRLYGKNNLERLEIDQVVCLGGDLFNIAIQSFHETDEAKKAEKLKNFAEVEAPRFLALYEKLLKEPGTGYFVGNTMTLADLCVYDQVFTETKWNKFKADDFPLIQALKKKVESHDKIKVYLATRKQT